MKYIFIIVVNCLFSLILVGQDGPANLQYNLQEVGQSNNFQMVYTYNNIGSGTKGTPFFNEDWVIGDVYLQNGQSLEGLKLKLDLFKDELILSKNYSEIYIPKSQVKGFKLQLESGDLTFVKSELAVDENIYMQYLVKNEPYSLVKQRKITFVKARNEGPYKSANAYDEYLMTPKYYLIQGEEVEKITGSANKFAKLIVGHTEETKTYIKDQNIDLNKEADLMILVEFINTLD
tara:strand:- start:215 stop:913 length:699 start_codon:yes stop_codon:yes gene_type:complete